MQTGVDALVVINMEVNLSGQVHRLSVGGLEIFEIGPDDVVRFARGNALGEFAIVVGIEFPPRFLVAGTADLDLNAVNRTVVRSPDRSNDESIGLLRFRLFGGGMKLAVNTP